MGQNLAEVSQLTKYGESYHQGDLPMASPIKFAHIVLKTTQYQEMVSWWKNFLEADVRHGDHFISFLSYDDEHHRLAIVQMPH